MDLVNWTRSGSLEETSVFLKQTTTMVTKQGREALTGWSMSSTLYRFKMAP